MVLRAHCDRCDQVVQDSSTTWVEVEVDGKTYRVMINEHLKDMYCLECTILILQACLRRLVPEPALVEPPAEAIAAYEKNTACLYKCEDCRGEVLPGTGLCEAHSGTHSAPQLPDDDIPF